MDKPKSNLGFKGMSVVIKIRDFFIPRRKVIDEVDIRPGFQVLDYGCGPGAYIIPLRERVGEKGRIYALDIHPLAIKSVQKLAKKRRFSNIKTILSDCKTGLEKSSVDLVCMYDVFHQLGGQETVLKEIHRILKPKGIFSFSDHHMSDDEIISQVTGMGFFKLKKRGKKTFAFLKI